MKHWEAAEKEIERLTGGKRTPGSGNKSLKGDVRMRGASWLIESKQTDADFINLQYAWLKDLERYSRTTDVLLVVWFYLRGWVYWHVGPGDPQCKPWSSMKIREGELPERIVTPHSTWELAPLESLRDLAKK